MHFYPYDPRFSLMDLTRWSRVYFNLFSPKSGALMIWSLQENAFFPFVLRAVFLTSEDEKTKGKSRLQIYKKNLTSYKKMHGHLCPCIFIFYGFRFKKASYIPKEKVKKPVSFHITPFPDTRIFFPYKHLYTPASEKRSDIKDIRGHLSCKTGEEKYEAKKRFSPCLWRRFLPLILYMQERII